MLEQLEPRLLLDGAVEELAVELFSVSPALFVENHGQWADESVRYAFQGDGANVLFTDAGPVFQVFKREPADEAAAADTPAAAEPGRMEVAGVGGGGAMYQVSISPYDSEFMLLACDMSGQYRSVDGGQTWELIHMRELNARTTVAPAFAADRTYAVNGAGWTPALEVSSDQGETWDDLLAGAAPWSGSITSLGVIDAGLDAVFVGTETGLWRSLDGGASWAPVGTGHCRAIVTFGQRAYATVDDRLMASIDGGASWQDIPVPPAASGILLDVAGAQVGEADPHLYVIADQVGTIRSVNGGGDWSVVQGWDSQAILEMPEGQTDRIYASQCQVARGDVWASSDGGDTWTSTFRMFGTGSNVNLSWIQTQLHWSYYVTYGGLAVDPSNPDVLFVATQGELYRSADGGASWDPAMATDLPGNRHVSIGLEVTTCWDYLWHPNDYDRQYICYTDIGFARSTDGGASYAWSNSGNPWGNTTYRIAFDPYAPGRIYAASSSRHDIPGWNHTTYDPSYRGGVAVSQNCGATWAPLGSGLPDDPCTDVLVDPASPPGALVLYATSFGTGVFKSVDGGLTWVDKSAGLGHGDNHHALRLHMDDQGNLYCLITALREGLTFPDDGGVWRSSDGGETWAEITAGMGFGWPTGMAVVDPDTIYISIYSCQGHAGEGGVWRTTDGGSSWNRVLTDQPLAEWHPPSYAHAMCVVVHPDNPEIVYCGAASQGLWVSPDAGASWVPFGDLPFGSILNVSFDPQDSTRIVVTTFGGGVWKGHYLPSWPVDLRQPLPGDANRDGIVDGLDYIVWSMHYHQSGGWGDGDFTGDGYVDGLDYVVWSNNYKAVIPGGGPASTLGEAVEQEAVAQLPKSEPVGEAGQGAIRRSFTFPASVAPLGPSVSAAEWARRAAGPGGWARHGGGVPSESDLAGGKEDGRDVPVGPVNRLRAIAPAGVAEEVKPVLLVSAGASGRHSPAHGLAALEDDLVDILGLVQLEAPL